MKGKYAMCWLTRIQDRLRGITPEQRAMINVRRLLAALGVDVSNLTDDEIKAGLERFAGAMAKTGITAVELDQSFQEVGRIL